VNDFILHQPPMLCVDKILGLQKTSEALIEATVPFEGPFFSFDGIIPEYFMELLAQSIAAVEGFRHKKSKVLKHEGKLVSIDEFTLHKQAEPGDTLLIKLKKTTEFGSFIVVKGWILRGKHLLAEGSIKVWNQEVKEDISV
jgi:3-hydroxymyristoyl/3-hydroxydecanoyl-(acyl carrier protein) dehydratase